MNKTSLRATLLASILLLSVCPAPFPQSAATSDGGGDERFVCPPCGADCHDTLDDKPGKCGTCGMTLVERASVPTVLVLLFDGVDMLSVAATASVFTASGAAFVHRVLESGPCWTTPVLANGWIYCRNSAGRLVCRDHRGE